MGQKNVEFARMFKWLFSITEVSHLVDIGTRYPGLKQPGLETDNLPFLIPM